MGNWDPSLEPLCAPIKTERRGREGLPLASLLKIGGALMLVTSIALVGALTLQANGGQTQSEATVVQETARTQTIIAPLSAAPRQPSQQLINMAEIEPAVGRPEFMPEPEAPDWRMDLGRWSEWSLAERAMTETTDGPQSLQAASSWRLSWPIQSTEHPQEITATTRPPAEATPPKTDQTIAAAHTHDLEHAPHGIATSLASPLNVTNQRPRIAIVIDDLGNNANAVQRLMSLAAKPTFAFLPYPAQTPKLARSAWNRGHEIVLHMPMQPSGPADPGPDALKNGLSGDVIAERIGAALANVPGATGMNNHMGSAFTANRAGMERVLREARAHGLVFLDSRTSSQSVAEAAAATQGTAFTTRDIFLDHDPSLGAIQGQLAKLEKIAHNHGTAIAIGHPYDTTIEALEQWMPEALEAGFEFTGIRDIVALRHCAKQPAAARCDPAIFVAELSASARR